MTRAISGFIRVSCIRQCFTPLSSVQLSAASVFIVKNSEEGLKHGFIGCGAVLQEADLIPQDQRAFASLLGDADVPIQDAPLPGIPLKPVKHCLAFFRRKRSAGTYHIWRAATGRFLNNFLNVGKTAIGESE